MTDVPVVAICICTYNRPQGLRKALDALQQLSFSPGREPAIHILVVENDARGLCRDFVTGYPGRYPIRYAIEPDPGVVHARNTCLALVGPETDFIAFIDDDEYPQPDWLERLLTAQEAHDADVVGGPVLAQFEVEPPEWIRQGPFFRRQRLATGTRVSRCFTNNVLLRADIVLKRGHRFDDEFNYSGGEDTMFFETLGRENCKIIWCDEAIVFEDNNATRATLRWQLRRGFQLGLSEAAVARRLGPRLPSTVFWFGKGMARVAGHSLLALVQAPFSRAWSFMSLKRCCTGLGNVAAVLRYRYEPYRR